MLRLSHESSSGILSRNRDAIFPDFSGFPDFHKSILSMKNVLISIKNWKDLASYVGFNDEDVASAIG